MTRASSLFGGRGSGQLKQYRVFAQSGIFIAQHNGILRATGFGAAASGARARDASTATGGGAGGFSQKVMRVFVGEAYVVTIGAGGVSVSGTSGIADGVDGGDTTIVGPRLALTAGGGKKGRASSTAPNPGGDGGTASGGDLNFEGGRGGTVFSATTAKITGGGAPNPFGLAAQTGTRGGDCTNATSTGQASGGGGVGGNGGDITGSGSMSTCGGGAGGPAVADSSTLIGPNALGDLLPAAPLELVVGLTTMGLNYFGGGGGESVGPGPGGGQHGNNGSSPPAKFGGGGGLGSAAGGLAAGGGGARGTGSALVTSGKGGDGFAVLELFYEVA